MHSTISSGSLVKEIEEARALKRKTLVAVCNAYDDSVIRFMKEGMIDEATTCVVNKMELAKTGVEVDLTLLGLKGILIKQNSLARERDGRWQEMLKSVSEVQELLALEPVPISPGGPCFSQLTKDDSIQSVVSDEDDDYVSHTGSENALSVLPMLDSLIALVKENPSDLKAFFASIDEIFQSIMGAWRQDTVHTALARAKGKSLFFFKGRTYSRVKIETVIPSPLNNFYTKTISLEGYLSSEGSLGILMSRFPVSVIRCVRNVLNDWTRIPFGDNLVVHGKFGEYELALPGRERAIRDILDEGLIRLAQVIRGICVDYLGVVTIVERPNYDDAKYVASADAISLYKAQQSGGGSVGGMFGFGS
jgi:hypothetical protein